MKHAAGVQLASTCVEGYKYTLKIAHERRVKLPWLPTLRSTVRVWQSALWALLVCHTADAAGFALPVASCKLLLAKHTTLHIRQESISNPPLPAAVSMFSAHFKFYSTQLQMQRTWCLNNHMNGNIINPQMQLETIYTATSSSSSSSSSSSNPQH